MFWRGAFPGFNFNIDKDFDAGPVTMEALQNELDAYTHEMRRYIRTQGVNVESLAQQVANPDGHVDVILKVISGATGIPVRILTGSERGELSSAQDESNWNDRVDERRVDYVEPFILRPFVDRLIQVGVLPEADYEVVWPDIDVPSEKEEADIAKVRTDSLVAYSNSQGADMIVTPTMFLRKFMGFTEDDIAQMAEALGGTDLDAEYDAAVEDKKVEEQAKLDQQMAAKAKQFGQAGLPVRQQPVQKKKQGKKKAKNMKR